MIPDLPALPDDWGDGSNPQDVFQLPEQWEELKARYAAFHRSKPLERVWEVAVELDANAVVLEREYIDVDYRSEFSHFYAQTFRRMSSRCERLHFMREAEYLGYTSLRPLKMRPLSRTMLRPPASLERHVSCRTGIEAHVFDQELRGLGAFPFMSQDARYGICAHAVIWMVAYYHHLIHQMRRVDISEIVNAASLRPETSRLTPSTGLTVPQMGTAFREIGLPAISYDIEQLKPQGAVTDVIRRYLNSRLPVVAITETHATVVIGYKAERDGKFFVRHDDASGPYQRVDWEVDPHGPWELLLVPLPGRIYLPGEEAEAAARQQINKLIASQETLAALRDRAAEQRLITYALRGADYKTGLSERGLPPDVVNMVSRVSTSNWIWIVELQARDAAAKGRRCVLGEIAVDATSDPEDPNILFGIFPGATFVWPPVGVEPDRWDNSRSPSDLVLTGAALHATV